MVQAFKDYTVQVEHNNNIIIIMKINIAYPRHQKLHYSK